MEPSIPGTTDYGDPSVAYGDSSVVYLTDDPASIIAELQETVNALHSKTEIILEYIEHVQASMHLGNELRM